MPLTGFDMSLLNRKYDIMKQGADADSLRAAAAMKATDNAIRYGGLGDGGSPLESLQAGLLEAQIKQAQVATAATKNQSSIASDENLRNQLAADQGFNSDTLSEEQAAALHDAISKNGLRSYKKGTAKVPKTGTAKLHKGEAVLNKPAAEGMGRGLIALMNKMGQQKMGMV